MAFNHPWDKGPGLNYYHWRQQARSRLLTGKFIAFALIEMLDNGVVAVAMREPKAVLGFFLFLCASDPD